MMEFVHDLSTIILAVFDMKDEDISKRYVTPSLDFKSMPKEELQELQAVLKKAIESSKINSGMVAAFWALIIAVLAITLAGPVQAIILGGIVFFVMYEVKRNTYWKLFFSISVHFYKPIKARHLYMSLLSFLAEYGIFALYTAPFKQFKTAREFAKANGGRKMNEGRAIYELNLINQLLKG